MLSRNRKDAYPQVWTSLCVILPAFQLAGLTLAAYARASFSMGEPYQMTELWQRAVKGAAAVRLMRDLAGQVHNGTDKH